MKTHYAGRLFLAGVVGLGLASVPRSAYAADPAPTDPKAAPADPKVATAAAGRTKEAIVADLNATSGELRSVLTSPKFLSDPTLRVELAPKVIPPLNKMISLFDELAAIDPQAKAQSAGVKNQFYTMLAMFGDEKAEASLKTQAESKDPAEAGPARASLYMIRWARAANDGAAQNQVLDEIEKAAKANPADDTMASMVMQMTQQGPATPEIKARASKLITDVFTGPQAKAMADDLGAEAKLKAVEGKPLVLAGTLNSGTQFTSADWKGKVILVDFWATWCGPCRAELPRVKKIYADFHEKGLEILGVSCDREATALQTFLDQNKDMPWPQLFDAKQPGWHPLAKGFGIQGIPTMFLIDKKGVCRTVEARENFEELIPKMLAE